MSTTQIPFIKWGDYHSKDEKNPDVLEIQVLDTETFDTDYSVNAHVKQKENDQWMEKILPLKSHDSNNASLLKQWSDRIKTKKIKKNSTVTIQTWIGISKNNHVIRKWRIEE